MPIQLRKTPRPPVPPSPNGHISVATAPAIQLIHKGFGTTDQAIHDAAETLLSALTLHLRHPTATLPGAVKPSLQRLLTATQEPTK